MEQLIRLLWLRNSPIQACNWNDLLQRNILRAVFTQMLSLTKSVMKTVNETDSCALANSVSLTAQDKATPTLFSFMTLRVPMLLSHGIDLNVSILYVDRVLYNSLFSSYEDMFPGNPARSWTTTLYTERRNYDVRRLKFINNLSQLWCLKNTMPLKTRKVDKKSGGDPFRSRD